MTVRAAFVFDPDRCTSCEACRIACGIENNGGRDTGWRTLMTFNPTRHPSLPTRHLSLACNHCEVPACALGCPAAAYDRDPKTGAVLLDPAKCIGCRYCSWVCPYDAPSFDEGLGVMTKCTFCAPRLAEGGQPACTQACPTGALSLGSREGGEPEPVYHGLGVTGLGPSLKVVPPRRQSPPPAMMIDEILGEVAAEDAASFQHVPAKKVTLRSEWTLALFTIVMPALVAWFGAGVADESRAPALWLFLTLGAIAMLASTAHLGKPLRAWRAVLGVRTSWLSREILFTVLFLGLAAAYLVAGRGPVALGWAAALAGVGLALSVDGVYRAVARDRPRALHSSEALLTVVFLLGIAASSPLVAVAGGALKGLLFIGRWSRGELGVARWLGATRLLSLAAALVVSSDWRAALALALAGEAIDRCAFYSELEPSTPAARMAEEMKRALDAGPRGPAHAVVRAFGTSTV